MVDPHPSPAGWYPDPDDDSSERWWGGTDWTSNARPLKAPAQPPPLPLPAAATQPPAGWYTDPQNAAREKWFDGADWTEVTRRASRLYAGAPGEPADASGRPRRPGFRVGNNRRMIFLPLIFVGVMFTGLGLTFVALTRTPANMSATTTGTVASLQFEQGSSSSPSCVPLAEFAVGGTTYMATALERVSPCPWAVGQSVVVAYDPAFPAKARIPGSNMLQYAMRGFVGIGVVALTAGLVSLVRSVVAPRLRAWLLRRRRRSWAAEG